MKDAVHRIRRLPSMYELELGVLEETEPLVELLFPDECDANSEEPFMIGVTLWSGTR